MEKDISTEEKIKEAARKIFLQKGFAGTRTRDIAEEAGINLALLNYYYRSKEKLFEIVMEESLKQILSKIIITANNETTSLLEKIDLIVNLYTDVLLENPQIPLFLLGEIQANPEKFKQKVGISHLVLKEVFIFRQIKEHLQKIGMENINPFHFIINAISMTIFPFIAKPMLQSITHIQESEFRQFVEERRKLIPVWIKSMVRL